MIHHDHYVYWGAVWCQDWMDMPGVRLKAASWSHVLAMGVITFEALAA